MTTRGRVFVESLREGSPVFERENARSDLFTVVILVHDVILLRDPRTRCWAELQLRTTDYYKRAADDGGQWQTA